MVVDKIGWLCMEQGWAGVQLWFCRQGEVGMVHQQGLEVVVHVWVPHVHIQALCAQIQVLLPSISVGLLHTPAISCVSHHCIGCQCTSISWGGGQWLQGNPHEPLELGPAHSSRRGFWMVVPWTPKIHIPPFASCILHTGVWYGSHTFQRPHRIREHL